MNRKRDDLIWRLRARFLQGASISDIATYYAIHRVRVETVLREALAQMIERVKTESL